MNGILLPRADLSDQVRDAMYALLAAQFDEVPRRQFDDDLATKNWVVLLRDDAGCLGGFSTIDCYDVEVGGERTTIVYSGDTVVAPSASAMSSALSRCWIGAVHRLRELAGHDRLVWFLIVSGYRTYRFLPLYWRTFYPRFDAPTPGATQELMDLLAETRFGHRYDRAAGVVRLHRPQVLRQALRGIPPRRLEDPHVRFFAGRNPGHEHGDELVCLAALTRDNLTPAGQRMWRAGDVALPIGAAT